MARIAGVELQNSWKVDYALTRIRGLGWPLVRKLVGKLRLDPKKRVSDLTPGEIAKISSGLENYPTEGELARIVKGNIQRLQTIGSYRGMRHSKNLPVRGQRTKTNARTKRGKRKTVGAFKKEALARMQTGKTGEEKK